MRYVFLCLFLGACFPPRFASHARLASELAEKTIALVHGDHPYCSGSWVSEHEILTANHCVDDVALYDTVQYVVRSDVVLLDGETKFAARDAKLIARDDTRDLALIEDVDSPQHGIAELSSGELMAGQAVFSMSSPLGLGWTFASGEIAAIRITAELGEPLAYVQATAPIGPGSSGSALYDESGRLVGVCRGTFSRGQLLNLFVHRDHVRAFLENSHAGK